MAGDRLFLNVAAPVKTFHGQLDAIKTLASMYERDLVDYYSNITLVTGMSGVGKTQLCRKFAFEYLSRKPHLNVVWIAGDSKESMDSSFRSLADKFDIRTRVGNQRHHRDTTEVISDISRNISGHEFTFIYDNVYIDPNICDSFSPNFYLVTAWKNCKMTPKFIVTSQHTDWDDFFGVKCSLYVDAMNQADAVEWVEDVLSVEKTTGISLVETFHRHPLGIEQAVGTIQSQRKADESYGIPQCINAMKLNSKYLKPCDAYDMQTLYKDNLSIAYETSREYLLSQGPSGKQAVEILMKCSFMYA